MSFGFSAGDFFAILRLAEVVRRRFVQAPKQYQAFKDEVETLSTIPFRMCGLDEDGFEPGHRDELENVIRKCEEILEELKDELDKFEVLKSDSTTGWSWRDKVRRQWKRVLWDQDEITQFQKRIRSNITIFNTIVGVLNSDLILGIKHDIQTIIQHQNDQERDQILNWLSSINPSARQKEVLKGRQEGTGTWFLETSEFKQWIEGKQQILFCSGIPGAGKTTLVSIIIHHLEQKFPNTDEIGITYFYCKYEDKHTLLTLLLGLLRQFCQRKASVPDRIRLMYTSHKTNNSSPDEGEVLSELQSVMTESTRVFLVVDALDECPLSHDARSVLGPFLKHLVHLRDQAGINILATSRSSSDSQITNALGACLSVEIEANTSDIASYLDSRLEDSNLDNPEWEFIKESPVLKQKIKDGIIKAARGMFLLVQLYLNLVLGETNRGTVQTLINRFCFGSHHEPYNKAYLATINRIECQSAAKVELAKKTIGWIAHTKRPLTVVELTHALTIEIGSNGFGEADVRRINQVTSSCYGLVVVDEQMYVRFVHATAREYFENKLATWFPQIHELITNSCLTYLSYDEFEGNRVYSMLEVEKILSEYPFYAYAARNWGDHFREHSGDQSMALRYLLDKAITFPSGDLRSSRFLGYRELPESGEKGEHIAAFFGLGDLMQNLLQIRPDNMEAKDDIGCTPLHLAADRGHETLVNLLVDHGARVDPVDNSNKTPLCLAASQGHETVVKVLLEKGADPDSLAKYGITPLHMAASQGHNKTAELLLTHRAKIGSLDNHDMTPLHKAAYQGHKSTVELLLDHSDKVGTLDDRHRALLHIAAHQGHNTMVEMLLERGANIESLNKYGETPLYMAAYQGHHSTARLLLDHGARIEFSDTYSRTPLQIAAYQGHETALKLLLDIGANLNPPSPGPQPLPAVASINDHDAVFHAFLEDRTDGVFSFLGRSPLHSASSEGHESIVRLLLQEGAEPDTPDRFGRTPLFAAVCGGHIAIVQILRQLPGVDNYRTDVWGVTPAREAEKRGLHQISILLQNSDEQDEPNLGPAPAPSSRLSSDRSCDFSWGSYFRHMRVMSSSGEEQLSGMRTSATDIPKY